MVKKQPIIITLLIVISILLSSCQDNQALKSRYQAERLFHRAESALRDASAFSPKLTNEQFSKITPLYQELVDFCSNSLNSIDSSQFPVEYNEFNYLTYQSIVRLSQLYYAQNQFTECIELNNRLLAELKIPPEHEASTYINLGQSLQASGDWDSAYTVYTSAIEKFTPPLSSNNEIILTVFNLPIYIYRVVNYIKSRPEAEKESKNTEAYYVNLIRQNPNSKIETASRSNLAKLYEETGQWEKELEQFNYLKDPTSNSYNMVMLKIADLLGGRLQQYDSALTIYDYLYERTERRDSIAVSGLYFKKALVKLELGKYDEARSLLDQIKKEYPRVYHSSPLFQYNLARSFELENRWARAESEYNLLIEKFKGSSEAMMTLLYLVDHFRDENRIEDSKRWFATAENYFNDLTGIGRGEMLEARALLYKADLYKRDGQFVKSADILISIYDKFSNSKIGRQALLNAIRLNQNELNNNQTADSLIHILKFSIAKTVSNVNSQDLLEN